MRPSRSPSSTGRKTFRRTHYVGGARNDVGQVMEGHVLAMEGTTRRMGSMDEAWTSDEKVWEGKEHGGSGD